ncbi:MAG: hypothetical protein IMW89_17845 [Ktedonobacteraceae bacterium]|nr:hypothetical protein [Ktedonobacteraceae bacterium]
MTGYINADGSALAGALNPASVGQALRVDSNGFLKVVTQQATGDGTAAASVPLVVLGVLNGSGAVDRVQGLGGALSTQDWSRQALLQGKGYTGSTGLINAPAGNYPLCIFNPIGSGKSILVISIRVGSASGTIVVALQAVTTNPAYPTAAFVANRKMGGPTSAIAASCTFTATPQTTSPPYLKTEIVTANPVELLSPLTGGLLLPAGSASGLTTWLQTTASGNSSINAEWIEF